MDHNTPTSTARSDLLLLWSVQLLTSLYMQENLISMVERQEKRSLGFKKVNSTSPIQYLHRPPYSHRNKVLDALLQHVSSLC